MITVGGLALVTTGGPITELIAPSLVHVVHGVAALLVVFGLYDPVRNDLRTVEWSQVLLSDPVKLRHSAGWMTPMDDEILGMFYDTDLILSPSIIAFNTGYSKKEVNRRLIKLEKHRLVERIERGKYRLTKFGEEYLLGHQPEDVGTTDDVGVPK
ncbi:ArsR family transcriptional regulator [Natrinema pellirubrum]|nr:ArsR family transcriptional regulator [Natrinema pellirubrum]